MKSFRFSLAALLLVVPYIAIGLIAWLQATDWWVIALNTMAHCALFISLIGIASSYGENRAIWVGFALFAWGYSFIATSEAGGLLDETFEWLYTKTSGPQRGAPFHHRRQIWNAWLTITSGCIGAVCTRYFYDRNHVAKG
jgi:membrane protease YdiL (CAAX protease family)